MVGQLDFCMHLHVHTAIEKNTDAWRGRIVKINDILPSKNKLAYH